MTMKGMDFMLQTELTRFKVKVGKTAIVDEWMSFLNEHMEETLLTLENEKMFVETIFCTGIQHKEKVEFLLRILIVGLIKNI